MARQMKDSGVEWIGEIPEEWEVCKLKKCMSFINGYPFDSSVLSSEGNCSVIRIGDLQNNDVLYDSALKVEYYEGLSKYLIRNNDILIAMSGATVGKLAIVNKITKRACANQRVGIIRSNINGYIKFILESSGFSSYITLLSEGTAQPNISTTNINNFSICLPPPEETQLIIVYLGSRCSEIDKVVEQTRATIEEYKKLKQAIITEAVTKGVRGPRPMKPSGVEWIGDIPGEWSLTKLKYNSILSPKSSPSDLVAEDCVTFTPMENIKNGFYIPNDAAFGRFACNSQYSEYEENDIVFAKVTPCFENDNIAIMSNLTNGRGFGSSELFVVRALNIELRYLYYVLRTSFFKSKGIESMTGTGGLKRVSSGVVRNYNFAIPPKDEQQEIATYLDTKCAEIDRIIEKKEQLIEELGSYKKSLIYEYVTGKKEIKIHNYLQNTIC